NQGSCMILMSNAASPKLRPHLRRLEQAAEMLLTDRKPPKFSLGVELDVQEDGRVRIKNVVAGGAAERAGFLTGDLLITADTKPIGKDPNAVLGDLLQKAEPITFII